MAAPTVTVDDLLDGHAAVDVECLDRVFSDGYVPNLQVGVPVVALVTGHPGG